MTETLTEDGLHEALCSLIAGADCAVVLEMGHDLPLEPQVHAAAYAACAKGLAEVTARPGTTAAIIRTTMVAGTVQVEVEAFGERPDSAGRPVSVERRRLPRWLRAARTSP
jgi:hypothetical protein